MNIGKTKNNYNKEERPKCFNYNKYGHMMKKCQKKKEKNPRKCFRCKKVGHIAKDYKEKQQIKTRSIKEESGDEDKKKGFGKDPKQTQYKKSMYLTLRIDMLFCIEGTILKKS